MEGVCSVTLKLDWFQSFCSGDHNNKMHLQNSFKMRLNWLNDSLNCNKFALKNIRRYRALDAGSTIPYNYKKWKFIARPTMCNEFSKYLHFIGNLYVNNTRGVDTNYSRHWDIGIFLVSVSDSLFICEEICSDKRLCCEINNGWCYNNTFHQISCFTQ